MNTFEAVILGIVQGATEFLPVSSSGHLVVGQRLLGIDLPGVGFEVAVHMGTLISILWVYRTRVLGLAEGTVRGEASAWRDTGLLLLATLPAAVLGIGFGDALDTVFDTPVWTGLGFLVTGAFLWSTRIPLREGHDGVITPRVALLIGLAQAAALMPGISRAGATVTAALWLGIAPLEAAAFSFLMALVAITGAGILAMPEVAGGNLGVAPGALVIGALTAGITGIAAIRTFVALLRRQDFHRFALYLWPLGIGFLLHLHFSAS
ncbi:MAG: undecaprenyl-diphosphate phosphatase [Longimicrobiales bacterium]|nr:undecaprenyl-diphosphate phosphatase [Longimicrobiales bacterium]